MAAVAVFHHLGAVLSPFGIEPWVDLVTPFAVVGTASLTLLALRAPPRALVVAVFAAIVYVDGHGIHLAANDIRGHDPLGTAADTAHFWDETFGHIEWHLGLFALIAAICIADARRPTALGRRAAVAIVLALGWTLFSNSVEGGTWWLELAATAFFVTWSLRERRQLLRVVAAAFAVAALAIGIWAAWHGGVPQFSELGWI